MYPKALLQWAEAGFAIARGSGYGVMGSRIVRKEILQAELNLVMTAGVGPKVVCSGNDPPAAGMVMVPMTSAFKAVRG